MILPNKLFLWFISLARLIVAVSVVTTKESDVREFLWSLNDKAAESASKLVNVQWEFENNNTNTAKKELFQLTSKAVKNARLIFEDVLRYHPWKSYSSPDIQRQLKLYSEVGMLALPDEEYEQFQKIMSDLEITQQNTTICDYYNKTKCDLHLPDIQEKLQTSQNAAELSYLWTEWRKATDREYEILLEKYVRLCNKAAVLNNYVNFRDYSLRNVEGSNIKEEMETLWEELKPLYSNIHAYVRRKLRDIYGEKVVPPRGLIPAHLLGNIWPENWKGITHRVIPFPEQDNFNFTLNMISEGYTPERMHKLAEDVFASMNFSIPLHLWFSDAPEMNKNMESCHPKIFNFYADGVRIKDCPKISLKNYLEDVRLLAKAEYMLQFHHQPFIYQAPADPGLEEAVSNIMTMSASTFGNLRKIGIFKGDLTEEIRLNRLFKLALEKVTSISFLLVQEFLRWDIYSGKTLEEAVNTLHVLREKFQGISTFTKELTFDPGGMGSIFSKLSLTHHFFGHFLELQMYESLCQSPKESQKEAELNECNLSENIEAGKILREMMSLGSSKTLSETISSTLGLNEISCKSMLKFFEPLTKWLTKENEKAGEFVGWEMKESPKEASPAKIRRKRSLDDYQSESKEDDTDITSSREPDRFQRLINKRSKNNLDGDSEMNERERKSAGNIENNEKKTKNSVANEQKQRRNAESYFKKRRSLANSGQKIKENSNELTSGEENGSGSSQKFSKFASRKTKRLSGYEYLGQSYQKPKLYTRTLTDKGKSSYQKRNDNLDMSGNFDNSASGSNPSGDNAGSGNSNNKMRFARRSYKNQRHIDREAASAESHHIWRRKDNYPNQGVRPSRNAQWHTDTKKDISRLLHSFGFAVENDDKDKIKELKKKLKGDSNSDLKSNIASKEGSYESMVDYNRMKSGDGRSDPGEDKGTNKLWSVKSYLSDNAKVMQSNSGLDKKDSMSSAHLSNSHMSHVAEEKTIGKKETSSSNEPSLVPGKERLTENSEAHLMQSGESGLRHINIDVPSLQALFQKSDLSAYGQKIITITPEITENKIRSDMNQMFSSKQAPSKFSNSYLYKYAPAGDTMQFKEKKEFREDLDTGSKSPYIIILGQVTPDMKEKLMQEKGVTILEADKQQLQSGVNLEEKKMSDKRGRASEQIYIVPIDLKNSQHNLMKPNHYAEHEHEAGHDPNTERDQESEEEQLHLEDNSKLDDKSSFYKTGKENPSELIISWNNDKNRKIVKRSKREHKKEIGDDKLKVVKIAPMKESFLEGLLGKSLDHANLDDKNVKILIHDGLLNGNSDLQSALASSSSSSSMGSPMALSSLSSAGLDQQQTSSLQSSASLSTLANSVLSALSPKSYSQVAKAANQRQESDLEEENLKEGGNAQSLGKKKGAKLYSDDDTKKLIDVDPAARGDDACCKKIILTPCPPKCPCPCPGPCPCPCPLPCPLPCPCPGPCPCPSPCPGPCPCPCPGPCPCPDPDCCKRIIECPPICCKPECDLCCKRPSECSLVNCQFKITKAKKPHERLTIMIYDRINPPAELPEPYDALAVISEILQRIQCCSCKPCCQLTEEDPDYPANDNTDQLKGNPNQPQDNKAKIQELSGEIPILGSDSPEEDETDDNAQNLQNSPSSSDEDKYQPKEKATPAIDQLTVFNKDKLKPVFIELRKIDDILKKRSHQK